METILLCGIGALCILNTVTYLILTKKVEKHQDTVNILVRDLNILSNRTWEIKTTLNKLLDYLGLIRIVKSEETIIKKTSKKK